tara:strand:- start:417 stop:1799 length:1383 start_codon:yes stop_codon:yes gene_type:complete
MVKAVIVIMGITGDLSKRKLIPSMYRLLKNKKINDFAIIGIGRRALSVEDIISGSKKFISKPDASILNSLEKKISYLQGDLDDTATYNALKKRLAGHAKKGLTNVLFYLATLPGHFDPIAQNLKSSGLSKSSKGWVRVVFEKPFGANLEDAKELNASIKKVFTEDQIYRIDHYLGKELVQNIAVLRFSNTVLEPLWNKNHIDHVQIILNEDIGVEDRGGFYDKYGAIKDVVQNHMLQLLALVAMEAPSSFNALQIRNEKFKVLQSTRSVDAQDTILGQYAGYSKEKDVSAGSSTETFAAMKVFVDNMRWQHVPFYLKTGKKMKEKKSLIYIQFEEAPGVLFKEGAKLEPNHLVITVQPSEGFYMTLNAKVPGSLDLTQVKMDFCHDCKYGANTPEAYETLLESVLAGDQSVFVRSDEVEQSWRIVDGIIDKELKVRSYAAGKDPKAASDFISKDGREWFV